MGRAFTILRSLIIWLSFFLSLVLCFSLPCSIVAVGGWVGAQYYLSVTYNLALVLLFAVSLLSSCAPVLVAVVGRKEVM